MTKIVVVQPVGLSLSQKKRLEKLGDVTYHDERTKTVDEGLERAKSQAGIF